MKLRSILLVASTIWAGASFAQTVPTVAPSPVLWSVHFDAERLRTGAGQELFASLDPMLTALSGQNASVPGGKLESVAVSGYPPRKGSGDPFPFLADFRFSAEGGVSRRFEAISKKRNAPVEELAGMPTIHFGHQGKEVWIAKIDDTRVLMSTSRAVLTTALAPDGSGPVADAVPRRPTEILGGKIEIEPLLGASPALRDSQLLKLLPHVEFHLLSEGGQLDLDASAQLDSERSARRASRMIDGMVAALSMHDAGGVPWDERLALKQDGGRLSMQLHLEPQEAKNLLDGFAREIESKAKGSIQGE